MKCLVTVATLILIYSPFLLSKPTTFTKNKEISNSAVTPQSAVKKLLLAEFKKNFKKSGLIKLKKQALNYSGKAIPALIEVMKSEKYPEKNRWIATFLVGQIMGKKSSPFLAKFLKHPSWVMRMASLKTLLALKDKRFASEFALALKDKSFIVRKQALDNIKKLDIRDKAGNVWAMLYDKRNYYNPKDGQRKRTNLIKEAIKVVGDLKFEKAKIPLLNMSQKEKYKDIFSEIDYSLSQITGKKSPKGLKSKKRFWSKIALVNKTF